MTYLRCWIPTAHPVHDWTKNGQLVTCAGHAFTGRRTADLPERPGSGASLADLLCHRDVTVRPDYTEIAVMVLLPSHLASRLAALLPDPERRDALAAAAHEIAREEDCAEMDRRDLTRTENYL